jgi:hypothetical protein
MKTIEQIKEILSLDPNDKEDAKLIQEMESQDDLRQYFLDTLESYVQEGFDKALDQKGISASMNFNIVLKINRILEEGLENWDESEYAQYGLPLFKTTAVKYGWSNWIGDDTGSENKYAASW